MEPQLLKVTCIEAKVRDADVGNLQEVLDTYYTRGALFVLTDGYLKVDTEPDEVWCDALKWDQVPDPEEFPDEDSYWEASCEVWQKEGKEGFLALLLEIAPYLESPLIILAVCDRDLEPGYSAQVWSVQPGTMEVKTLTVRHNPLC
jgi:hypothetical protein